MERIYKIAYAAGSRADYSIVQHYLAYLDKDNQIDLEILVTGALLSEQYGNQVTLIQDDGFQIGAEIKVFLDSSSNAKIIATMSSVLEQFGKLFEQKKYDLLIILGDRYEMFSVAIAAAIQNIPILHIHGGEATYANYDEFMRHSITKMSRFHFTVTEEYRKRVIQLGENPENVYNLGALGAENCLRMEEEKIPDYIKQLEPKNYLVILFHPETLTELKALDQIRELLAVADKIKTKQIIFIGSNADTHAEQIRDTIKEYVQNNKNAIYYENLHTDAYHYLLKNAICLIGNSSSGIIEAPSLGIYTINIGDRQKGRSRGNSVIDVSCKKEEIYNALKQVISAGNIKIENPYYQENVAERYYLATKRIIMQIADGIGLKIFYDIKRGNFMQEV